MDRGGICINRILVFSTLPDYDSDDRVADWTEQVRGTHQYAQQFVFHIARTLISENISCADCIAIQRHLLGMDLSEYSGVIILHGTEYFPYTAAALSYLLSDLAIPVLLVPVNRLLGQEKNHRAECMDGAVTMLLGQSPLRGIYAVLKNETTGKLEVHLGTRITQPAPFDYHFSSAISGSYGEIAAGRFRFHSHPANPDVHTVSALLGPSIRPESAADILFIKAYRHMTYHYYRFPANKPAAVLHEIFDAKTMVKKDEISGLCQFCTACRKQNIPLYIVPLNNNEDDFLTSMQSVIVSGALAFTNITVASLYAKLVYGYAMKATPELLRRNIAFEQF